jgi:hypothetical protein
MSIPDQLRAQVLNEIYGGRRSGEMALDYLDRIAALIDGLVADEREKALTPVLALAQELADVACAHHASVAGDAYADAADRIVAVVNGTYP